MSIVGDHPTVLVDGVAIDVEIAPLIRALWDSGIETLNSCQDNGDNHCVWIEFATPADASTFLNAVMGRLGDYRTLYGRAMGSAMDTPDVWTYQVFPMNYGIQESIVDDEIQERRVGPNDVDFSISIRFPRRDLPAVLRRLEARPKQYASGSRLHRGRRGAYYAPADHDRLHDAAR